MGAAHQTPPLVGAGRNSWDAWQAGNYLGAVGHTGLFSIEGLGAAESWLGRGMMGGGGLMMVTSSGALVPVAAPFAVGGAAMTAHGSVVMSKALLECRGKDGQYAKTPPGNLNKLKGNQGWRDKKGNIWKKDMKHKDHWDVADPKTGKKIKEIDFNGNQIWPQGAKNKGKR